MGNVSSQVGLYLRRMCIGCISTVRCGPQMYRSLKLEELLTLDSFFKKQRNKNAEYVVMVVHRYNAARNDVLLCTIFHVP